MQISKAGKLKELASKAFFNLHVLFRKECCYTKAREMVTTSGMWGGPLAASFLWDPVCLLSSPLSPPFSSCFTKCFPSSHQLPYPSSTNSQQLTPFHSISLPAEFPPHSKAYSWTNNPKLIALLLKCTKNPSSTTSYPHSGPDSNLPLGSRFITSFQKLGLWLILSRQIS